MSLPSGQRVPYGVAVQMQGGVPGMAQMPAGMSPVGGIPGMQGMQGLGGMPGMTAVQMQAGGMSRASNGLGGMYPGAEKQGMLPGAPQGYPGLGQAGLLATSSSLGQPGAAYYGSGQPTYIPVSCADGQQRYMVSPNYGLRTTSPLGSSQSMMSSSPYPLGMGGYSMQSSMAQQVPVTMTSLVSQAGSPYPTYIGSQFTPLQIQASQNPYAGHPLYPSPYAGLQMQQGQVPSSQFSRVATVPVGGPSPSGLPLAYPTAAHYQGP
ncbi:collagen alpha-2(IV) chain-like [Mya arenaria]|uniref:collagen alpha-2(IV) chain-like n=1 Tax=Mya arenaria TaxID=6604 RepID=UPI0022E3B1A6|nr:collagen alpha-2(IV) chain-like [Mya arenaria]XP_052816228.1 collagen alpha-2(IV) chain-like [Mya arenaria]